MYYSRIPNSAKSWQENCQNLRELGPEADLVTRQSADCSKSGTNQAICLGQTPEPQMHRIGGALARPSWIDRAELRDRREYDRFVREADLGSLP